MKEHHGADELGNRTFPVWPQAASLCGTSLNVSSYGPRDSPNVFCRLATAGIPFAG